MGADLFVSIGPTKGLKMDEVERTFRGPKPLRVPNLANTFLVFLLEVRGCHLFVTKRQARRATVMVAEDLCTGRIPKLK